MNHVVKIITVIVLICSATKCSKAQEDKSEENNIESIERVRDLTESTCLDTDSSFQVTGQGTITCTSGWSGATLATKCQDSQFLSSCPRLCGTCCDDFSSEQRFVITSVYLPSGNNKKCQWVLNKDTYYRCSLEEVIYHCAGSCRTCDTLQPSVQPTSMPSQGPSISPTLLPSVSPSDNPSLAPSENPTLLPSTSPSNMPSTVPSKLPSLYPSSAPSSNPSIVPSSKPSDEPSFSPSMCVDEDDWATVDPSGTFTPKNCAAIEEMPDFWCDFMSQFPKDGKSTLEACCICGGGKHVPISPSSVPSIYTHMPSISHGPSNIPSEFPSMKPSECVDEQDFLWDVNAGLGCAQMSSGFCTQFMGTVYNGKNTMTACCVCGGGTHVPALP
jgi:hypothetical protein